MATVYFLGTATAVAQVSTVQITADDAATTYTLTVGSETVSCSGTGTGVNDTATALGAAWNASTHIYFTTVTATVATDTVTLTADTEGVPFVTTSSVAGGGGTIGAVATPTASAGPNDWSTAANWSGAAVPVNNDDVIVDDCGINICWGFAQSAVTLDSLTIPKTYTGKIGLNYRVFATSSDGDTTDSTAVEYRDVYLNIKVDKTNGHVRIGEHTGPGNPAGSSRIMLDLDNTAAEVFVSGTASTTADSGRPAVRLLANHGTTVIFVLEAPGGVGLATEKPNETSTILTLFVDGSQSNTRAYTGDGCTIGNFEQYDGDTLIRATGTITNFLAYGGKIETRGTFLITTLTAGIAGHAGGPSLVVNHENGANPIITTANFYSGVADFTQYIDTRTITTANLGQSGVVKATTDLALTNKYAISSAANKYALTMSEA